MLNNLDLFKVRLIGELAKSQSVLTTAKSMGITPSAVSQNIKTLEHILGKPLFLRMGKSLKPTPLALEISRKAQDFFMDLAILLEESQEKIAEIKIGAPPIFGSTALLDRLEIVRVKHPSIHLRISLLDTKRLTEDLLNGNIDFAFIDNGPHLKAFSELLTEPFITEELVLCCSHEFYRTHLRISQSLKTLKSLPHIPYNRDKEGLYKWYAHHFNQVPDFSSPLTIDHPHGVLGAVIKGWGLGVVPKALIGTGKESKISIVDGPKTPLKSQVLLAQNKSRIPTRFEKAVISLLLQK